MARLIFFGMEGVGWGWGEKGPGLLQGRDFLRGGQEVGVAVPRPGDAPQQDGAGVRRGKGAEVVPEQVDVRPVRLTARERVLIDPDLRDEPADARLRGGLAARRPLEIVSVDSAQVYRGLDIGTAKPCAEERARVHRLRLLPSVNAASPPRWTRR